MATTKFLEVKNRTFLQAIKLRGNCLPAKASRPADLIRLRLLEVRYTAPVPGVKLTNAFFPGGWSFKLDGGSSALEILDEFENVWIRVIEIDGVPTFTVRPLYGWLITGWDALNGMLKLSVYHPDGSLISLVSSTYESGKTFAEKLAMAEAYIDKMYDSLNYPANWRELGATMPTKA